MRSWLIADAVREDQGCKERIVIPALDDGPIICQAAVPLPENPTPESLAEAVLAQEHVIYPQALKLLAEGRLVIEGSVVRIKAA